MINPSKVNAQEKVYNQKKKRILDGMDTSYNWGLIIMCEGSY